MSYQVGDRILLDNSVPATITRTGVYINAAHDERETGVSVRPIGGRAKAVALWRVRPCPYCAPDEPCAQHVP